MSTIGENRLQVYELLYSHPLYECMNDKREINVLILGNGWVGVEAFKAVFWCGQYPNAKLNITVAVENPAEYEALLKEKLPGLNNFAKFHENETPKYCYASISMQKVSYDSIKTAGLSGLKEQLGIREQGYIVVSTGDSDADYCIALELKEIMPNWAQAYIFSKPADANDNNQLHFIDEFQDKKVLQDLTKYAKNINFLYAMKEHKNVLDRNSVDQSFDKEIEEEFYNSPLAEDTVQSIVGNFLGRPYDADSSLANAVHARYKRHFCEEQYHISELEAITKAIVNKEDPRDSTYDSLVKWEHRRWNAFMVIRGYRYPTEAEKRTLFNGINRQRCDNKNSLWHICMCECENEKELLSKHPEYWGDGKAHPELSELDQASLLCYDILSERVKDNKKLEALKEKGAEHISRDFKPTDDYRRDEQNLRGLKERGRNYITRLAEDVPNAYELIHLQLPNLEESLDEAEKKVFDYLCARNKHTDFLDTDKELIDYLPICELMCQEKLLIITVIEKLAFSDVLVPWLLFPKKALFIVNKSSYTGGIKDFFEKHGNCNNIEIRTEKSIKQKSVYECIQKTIQKNPDQIVVLNIAHNASPDVSLAIGRFFETNPIITASSRCTIKNFNNKLFLPCDYRNKELKLPDLLGIMGWKEESTEAHIDSNTLEALEEFYYSNPDRWKNDDGILRGHLREEWGYKDNKRVGPNNFIKRKDIDEKNRKQLIDTLDKLMECSVLNYSISSDETITIKYIEKKLIEKDGTLFEQLVYESLLKTGLFDDVMCGVKFQWDGVENELDEIGIIKNIPIFVSCKTSKVNADYKGYIYEIASEASSFNGKAALAIPFDLSNPMTREERTVIARAKAMGVALLDQPILRNQEKLREEIKKILTNLS